MVFRTSFALAAAAAFLLPSTQGQTFQRLGSCPDLGCILPPDQSDVSIYLFFFRLWSNMLNDIHSSCLANFSTSVSKFTPR